MFAYLIFKTKKTLLFLMHFVKLFRYIRYRLRQNRFRKDRYGWSKNHNITLTRYCHFQGRIIGGNLI